MIKEHITNHTNFYNTIRMIMIFFIVVVSSCSNKNATTIKIDFEEVIDKYEQIYFRRNSIQSNNIYYSFFIRQNDSYAVNISVVGDKNYAISEIIMPGGNKKNTFIGYTTFGNKKIVVNDVGIKDINILQDIKQKLIESDPQFPSPSENGHWDPYSFDFVIDSLGIHESVPQ